MSSRENRAYVVDYVIQKPDGELQTGAITYAVPDLFSAIEKSKDMVEDYKEKMPEDEIRVWNVGLSAAYQLKELFAVKEEDNDY